MRRAAAASMARRGPADARRVAGFGGARFNLECAVPGPSRPRPAALATPSPARRRHASTTAAAPLRVAVIGSGPSGFYTASRLLHLLPATSALGQRLEVHMYERLPTPYGLARYGVAPDHPEVKHKFDELQADARFRFFGNVSVGTQPSAAAPADPASASSPDDLAPPPRAALSRYTYPHAVHLQLSALLPHYTSTIFTYGSSLSNPLTSVAGSSSSPAPLAGVYPALSFVSWYNGHPAFAHLDPPLANVRAVDIVGHGNVALDVARILLSDPAKLATTDMPSAVVDHLAAARVETVRAVGRRGPGQVAFTTKEFREMTRLGVGYAGVDAALMRQAHELVGDDDRPRRRLLGVMAKPVAADSGRTFELGFLRSPTRFVGDGGGSVRAVEWARNALVGPAATAGAPSSQAAAVPRGQVRAVPTGETVTTATDMVIESVGYRSEPLGLGEWTVPFDATRGRVRNDAGRVIGDDGVPVPGLYAAGWAARGPVGVIAATMADAYALADVVIADVADPHLGAARPQAQATGLPDELDRATKDGRVVGMAEWLRIDAAEVERARRAGLGKPREKFRTVEDMLSVL